MKKKKSFWSMIARYAIALLFISSWAVLGVAIAINSARVDIGGKVTFQATDVYADITGAITGTKTTNTLEDIHLDASTTSFTSPSSWKNLVFDFVQDTNNIVFTINVTNKSAERSLWVDFDDTISALNTIVIRKVAGTEVGAFKKTEVLASETKKFEIIMQVASLNKSVSGDFNLNLKLSNDEPEDVVLDESEYSTISFEFDEDAKTALICEGNDLPSGRLYIPEKVLHNGEEYEIVGVVNDAQFMGISELTSIVLPETHPFTLDTGFDACNISYIYVPANVTFSSRAPLTENNLKRISVDDNHPKYFVKDNALIEKDTNTLILGTTTVPDIVEEIAEFAFCGRDITSISIPASVKTISFNAFNKCYNLKSVIIGQNVTNIGAYQTSSFSAMAFSECTSLESIVVDPNNSTFYSYENGVYTKADNTFFLGCKNTIIKEGTTTIAGYAFEHCQGQTITIPSSVTSIGEYAFAYSDFSSIIFENTTGWTATSRKSSVQLNASDLENPATASTLLTKTYMTSTWTRA